MSSPQFIILLIVLTTVFCVIIVTSNYRASKKSKEVFEKLRDMRILINLLEMRGEIKMSKQVQSLGALLKAEPTEEAYNEYVTLLMNKVKDRYEKTFFKYYKSRKETDNPLEMYSMLEFRIEPEDMETFLRMNALFIRHNLDNKEITKRVVQRFGEFIPLENARILFEEREGLSTLSFVSSIATESTITILLAFIAETEYEDWKKLYEEKEINEEK